ncbi:MAG TPA: carbamoyltransferase HypF [Polyangiaceae bacterium]|nr:carbamoyltransferase HypF [Polyangiaceae bacterium]
MSGEGADLARVDVVVRGVVQGVGFRPFVARNAVTLGLSGHVKNVGGEVRIAAEGRREPLNELVRRLAREPPVAAVVRDVEVTWGAATGLGPFEVASSEVATSAAWIGPDRATCDACLREFDDPLDRRFGYAFVACTDCGPRLTAVTSAPYERARTTWASFEPCARCRAEQRSPSDRRYAAENVACTDCGPRLTFRRRDDVGCADALARTIACLARGEIGAVKGVGGYHLVCDATNDAAVRRLRERKGRDDKPFALLVETLADACALARCDAVERELLGSPGRPIVLVRRAPPRSARAVSDAVAPGSPLFGIMLPYTPTLLALARGVARPLVCTSGNRSSEPMAIDERAAEDQLGALADFFLHHDRPIAVRADDSVVRVVGGAPRFGRRGRGFAPTLVELGEAAGETVLALGAELKSTFATATGPHALVSHHVGDLLEVATEEELARAVEHHLRLTAASPAVIAHDLHPDFASTRFAIELARRTGARRIAVQHHHAHFAAALAETAIRGPALGVIFDGLGLGLDGAWWGGEMLVGDAASSRRFARLRYVPMPGGDLAAREPWRMALAHLVDAAEDTASLERWASRQQIDLVARAAMRGVQSPLTSSVGRLFDAVASLAGLRGRATFEAQAAIALEHAAEDGRSDEPYPFDLTEERGEHVVDTRPMVRAIARDVREGADPSEIATRFHASLVRVVIQVANLARLRFGISTVVLSGGVFMNAVLVERSFAALRAAGFFVARPTLLPPNDGGLALGQLAHVVASRGGLT